MDGYRVGERLYLSPPRRGDIDRHPERVVTRVYSLHPRGSTYKQPTSRKPARASERSAIKTQRRPLRCARTARITISATTPESVYPSPGRIRDSRCIPAARVRRGIIIPISQRASARNCAYTAERVFASAARDCRSFKTLSISSCAVGLYKSRIRSQHLTLARFCRRKRISRLGRDNSDCVKLSFSQAFNDNLARRRCEMYSRHANRAIFPRLYRY